MVFIELNKVNKSILDEDEEIKVLKNVNLKIEKGDLAIITGPSLSGKTTFLNVLSLTEDITDGEVLIDEVNVSELSKRKKVKYRRNNVGFILRQYGLLSNLTVVENVSINGSKTRDKSEVLKLLKKLSLTKKKDALQSQLSDEEITKVLIARASIKKPSLLLCDDLIDNLDEKSTKQVMKLFLSMAKKDKTTIILVTNSQKLHVLANEVITIKNGTVSNVKTNKKPKTVGDLSW